MKDRYRKTVTSIDSLAILILYENHKFKLSQKLKKNLEDRDIIRDWNGGSKLTAHGEWLRDKILKNWDI